MVSVPSVCSIASSNSSSSEPVARVSQPMVQSAHVECAHVMFHAQPLCVHVPVCVCVCVCGRVYRINNAGTNAYRYGPLIESGDEELATIVGTNVGDTAAHNVQMQL